MMGMQMQTSPNTFKLYPYFYFNVSGNYIFRVNCPQGLRSKHHTVQDVF